MAATRIGALILCMSWLICATVQASETVSALPAENVGEGAPAIRGLDAPPFSAASPAESPPWHADGQRLRRRGNAMRAAGWASVGAGGIFAVTSTALAFRIKHCESSGVTCDTPMFSPLSLHSDTRPRMAAGLTGSLGVVLATAVALPNLVVGKRYQRLGDNVLSGTYAPLESADYWSARLAIGEQKQRSGRAIRNTGLVSFAVFGALSAAGFALSTSARGDIGGHKTSAAGFALSTDDGLAPMSGRGLKGTFADSDKRVILLSSGLGGLIFLAAPLTITGFSMEARGRNIVRREQQRPAPAFTFVPETYADGAGGRVLVVF